MAVPVYRGQFGKREAERLLWRGGFGPRPGEAEKVARLGLEHAVHKLTNPGRDHLRGPKPQDDNGHPLAPFDAYGHDQLWWLDRMVRTTTPLRERMTLIWHDWFATSGETSNARLMIRQNQLFRQHALGSFSTLLMQVTKDPAMLLWLSGTDNTKDSPNENYGRELMELFTIGADRHGYTERDVREQARALTGWRNDWNDNLGPVHFRFDKRRHDTGVKRIFGKHGHFDWKDSCRLCVHHRLHSSFFVPKLWSYFIPTPPPRGTQRALQRLYVHHGYQVKPVVSAILKHPALYNGPRMVKSPAVYTAGLLRSLRRGIDTEAWVWLMRLAGQSLFYPPNVGGWDDTRWLDTATFWGRWEIASHAIRKRAVDTDKARLPADAVRLMRQAEHLLGNPTVTGQTHSALKHFVKTALHDADDRGKKRVYPALIENALRQLLATSPDLQTS
jgi:uncharacterized protein (DUF1800 family)